MALSPFSIITMSAILIAAPVNTVNKRHCIVDKKRNYYSYKMNLTKYSAADYDQ